MIYLNDRSGLQFAKIDSADFPTVQKFSGTWALAGAGRRRRYVQGKWYNPQTDRHETVYLHRWIVGADEDTLVQLGRDPLDCRRQNLHVSLKRRSYTRQIERRSTPTDRLQYSKALAARLAQGSPLTSAQVLRGLQRGTLDANTERTASRLTGKRITSLPPLRVRAGWEHRLPVILEALESSAADLLFRRDVEALFRVSRNTAVKLLDRFGASFYGSALAVARNGLLEALRRIETDPAISFERERHISTLRTATRDELGDALGVAAKRLVGNRSYLQGEAARAHRETRFAQFPESICLTKTELCLQFHGFADFLQQVGLIVYALQNDTDEIEQFLER